MVAGGGGDRCRQAFFKEMRNFMPSINDLFGQ